MKKVSVDIIVLIVLVLGLIGLVVFFGIKYTNVKAGEETKVTDIDNKAKSLDQSQNKENIIEVTKTEDELFQEYMDNYIEKLKSVVKYTGVDNGIDKNYENMSRISIHNDTTYSSTPAFSCVREVYIDANFDVYLSFDTNSEYYNASQGEKMKINSDCVNIYLFEIGNGGFYQLLMLKKDGTVDKCSGVDLNNGNIKVEKIENVKNVINIIPINYGGACGYEFITITGK